MRGLLAGRGPADVQMCCGPLEMALTCDLPLHQPGPSQLPCQLSPTFRTISVLPESPGSLLHEGSTWQRLFFPSFFFWFVFFKRLKASCHVSQQHMKGSAYFPHTVAPSLRPQECKVLESKHQWITVGTLQMAGLHRLPRKSEHSLPNRSCVSHSPRRLGGSCFSPSRLQMFPQESDERREGPETQVTSMSACEREVGVQAGARARPPQPCLKGVRLRGAGHAAL